LVAALGHECKGTKKFIVAGLIDKVFSKKVRNALRFQQKNSPTLSAG
jgi:hypothetical protein